MTNTVYENENYLVVTSEEDLNFEIEAHGSLYVRGYEVRHRHTGIVEFRTPTMPDALFTAEQLNHALLNKTWQWQRKQVEAEAKPKADMDRIVN